MSHLDGNVEDELSFNSTQMKFILLTNVKICWHLTIGEQDKKLALMF